MCGAQALFARGGAELMMDNLVEAFRAAGHRAELVRLPVAWDKGRLFDAPLAWRLAPLDADVAVAINFPSYYVRHPNKVVWLAHQHRGAYDAADAAWSDLGLDEDSLETQRLLSDWDARVLEEARGLFSISAVVAARLARYNGLAATPLYHPPPLAESLHPGSFGDYVFCPTRLERNKRPGLAVDALAEMASGTRVVLAGRGSLEDELRAAAGGDARLELAGFVPDDELVERMAGALAVVYAPYDEDYGYVTLQAFLAGKPVITATDSGGVLEWVVDGENGVVTDGSPAAIAAAVDALAAAPERARAMGEAGRAGAAGLSWGPVVETLLAAAS